MSPRAPWWIDGGTETCPSCTHLYAYHIERRCYACDRPMCPFCVTTVSVSVGVACPECHAEEGEGGGTGHAGPGRRAGRTSSSEEEKR